MSPPNFAFPGTILGTYLNEQMNQNESLSIESIYVLPLFSEHSICEQLNTTHSSFCSWVVLDTTATYGSSSGAAAALSAASRSRASAASTAAASRAAVRAAALLRDPLLPFEALPDVALGAARRISDAAVGDKLGACAVNALRSWPWSFSKPSAFLAAIFASALFELHPITRPESKCDSALPSSSLQQQERTR